MVAVGTHKIAILIVLLTVLQSFCHEKRFPASVGNLEKKEMEDKEKLAEKLVKSGLEETAIILQKGDVKLDSLNTPFLDKGKIYRITRFLPTRPLIIYVGVDGEENTYLLNADAEKFFEFVLKSGLRIDKKELKLEYAKVYLKVVYLPNGRLEIVENVQDLKPRPNLSEEKRREFDEFQERFKTVVKKPECQESRCVLFVVKGQDLVKMELEIAGDGKVNVKETVLEKDLLIPYAL
ncbi:MAG: hypothetical protein D6687_12370 [Acidobacteria bacterium]|jgi:hypothetical protein|nr:MAG: hypothetical protein D6687_12370 [Acidobacteriota bacterium]GIU82511.1 MAG: hypothetical protein KatS3mg006_1575 [Pyrinomonadaceae bacterium]